ncbi:hypothetical protein Z043_125718, partial [Scleropages formosus]
DCGVSFRQLKLYKQHARSVEHKQHPSNRSLLVPSGRSPDVASMGIEQRPPPVQPRRRPLEVTRRGIERVRGAGRHGDLVGGLCVRDSLHSRFVCSAAVLLPHIVVRIRAETSGMEEAPLGLHLVTMCYSSGISADPFYLCHSCRERCSNNLIVRHLSSAEHRFSYFVSLCARKVCAATPLPLLFPASRAACAPKHTFTHLRKSSKVRGETSRFKTSEEKNASELQGGICSHTRRYSYRVGAAVYRRRAADTRELQPPSERGEGTRYCSAPQAPSFSSLCRPQASAKPYLLTFGWTPRPDPTAALKPGVVLMKKDTGPLMILDVPKKLFESMRKSPYFQIVKDILRQRLPEKLQVEKRPRVTLRDFAEREKRTHPLLGSRPTGVGLFGGACSARAQRVLPAGLGFLVEYGDAARTWLCGYLCLLCGRKLHQNEAIAHLLGFEHVFAALVSSSGAGWEVKLDPEDFEKVDSLSFENGELRDVLLRNRGETGFQLRAAAEGGAHCGHCPLRVPAALAKLQAVSGECGESAPRLSGTPAPERVGDGVDRAPAGDEAVAPRSSSESLLDEDEQELRRFIATPHRVEPVVGECSPRPACCVKMPRSTVVVHLSGCEHRYLYLQWWTLVSPGALLTVLTALLQRWQHPELLRRYKSQNQTQTQELELMAATLRTAAQELEQLEGCGEVQ